MSGRRLRVGLIGTGVGIRTYLPGFRATGRADVVAISGSGAARAEEVADANGIPVAYGGFDQLCADESLDLICVASPNEFHLEHYVAAAASGKPVVIEKPAATDLDGLRLLLDVPTAPGQFVLLDHQLRFNPYLRALREVIRSGEIGRPYSVRVHQQGVGFLSADTRYSWRFDAERGGGVRLAMGSHLVDLLGFLLDDPGADSVFGTTDVVVPVRQDDAGVPRTVTASAAFSAMVRVGGTTGTLSASAAAQSRNLLDVDVLATAGEAHFSLADKLSVSTRRGDRVIREVAGADPDEVHNRKSVFKTSFNRLARAVVEAILDGRPDAVADGCSLHDQAANLRTLDAILESARTGEAIVLGTPLPSHADVVRRSTTGAGRSRPVGRVA